MVARSKSHRIGVASQVDQCSAPLVHGKPPASGGLAREERRDGQDRQDGIATNGTSRSAMAARIACFSIARPAAGSSTPSSINHLPDYPIVYVELHTSSAFSFLQ